MSGTTAYLVAWRSKATGMYRDAGIYDTPRPDSPIKGEEPVVLARAVSRHSGSLGWSHAANELRRLVATSDKLRWARNLPTLRRRLSFAAKAMRRLRRFGARLIRRRRR